MIYGGAIPIRRFWFEPHSLEQRRRAALGGCVRAFVRSDHCSPQDVVVLGVAGFLAELALPLFESALTGMEKHRLFPPPRPPTEAR